MRFRDSIDEYMHDQRSAGRISSDASETVYRLRLNQLAEDVHNRDPRYVGREDVKKCLARWPHPNTQLHSRSIFVAFFDWLLEEGYRKDNPARQTRTGLSLCYRVDLLRGVGSKSCSDGSGTFFGASRRWRSS